MTIVEKRSADYRASIRRDGKFTPNEPHDIVAALFDRSFWDQILGLIEERCRNAAAVNILEDRIDNAETWLSRSAALKKLRQGE